MYLHEKVIRRISYLIHSKVLFHLGHSTCSLRQSLDFYFGQRNYEIHWRDHLSFSRVLIQDIILFNQFHNNSFQ